MKYLLLSVILSFFFLSCSQSKQLESTPQDMAMLSVDATVAETQQPVSKELQDYAAFIKRLDSADVSTVTVAAQKFQEAFQHKSKPLGDSAYVLFERYYEAVDKTLNELHANDTVNYDALVLMHPTGEPLPVPEKVLAYSQKLKENGFEVAMTEGFTYILQDRDFISQWFFPHVSETLKAYLSQLNKENKEGFSDDAALVITPTELAERVIWWERFYEAHPDFMVSANAAETRKYYLTSLLEGMDNSPVVWSYEVPAFDEGYRAAYQHLLTKYPASKAASAVGPYLKALQTKQFETAEKLLETYRNEGTVTKWQE